MFRSRLEQILEKVDGACAAMIVGADGIVLEKAGAAEQAEELFSELGAAELTQLLKSSQRTLGQLDAGAVQEQTILTDHFCVILRALSHHYFVALVLSAEGNYGRARYELRKAQLALQEEFLG
ncbi:MAG: hypothetical protein HY652_07615 [Acidobacteria bacterium]|nr:hypothetical protein [Acidobacteriota bacterium]